MLQLIIQMIVVLLALSVAWWLIDYIPVPGPFNRWAKIVVVILAALYLINILLSLGGVNLGFPR